MDTVHKFNLKNIQNLLVNGFTEEELRNDLCFLNATFRPLHDRLAQSSSKQHIAVQIVQYAERTLELKTLLDWAKERNPTMYKEHVPYYIYSSDGKSAVNGISPLIPPRTLKPPIKPNESLDSWDMARIKSCLHAQSEIVAEEAKEQAGGDQLKILEDLVPVTFALRWKRGYAFALEKLLGIRESEPPSPEEVKEHTGSNKADDVVSVLWRNRKALIPLIARWKMPGSEWLLPDGEQYPQKIGESFLGNEVPDHDNRDALERMQAELAEAEDVVEETFITTRAAKTQLNSGQDLPPELPPDLFPDLSKP